MQRHRLLTILVILVMSASLVSAENMTLDYLYRYNCQSGSGVDHLLTALEVGADRAIIAGYGALALVDLTTLTVEGAQDYLSRIKNHNARNLYLYGSYVFVNEHAMGSQGATAYGFSVVRISGDRLQDVTRVHETGALLEKMCISGTYLYVTAHNKGIRIYDISNPAAPVKVGSLTSGFTDAFDIAISGTTAYVADGAGGLKIVDVTNPANPSLIGGEDLTTSVGTAEAITVRNGKVYMLVGSSGMAVYDGSNLGSRRIISTNGFAEDLAWVGDYLAVSTYPGIRVFDVSAGNPILVASDNSNRRGPVGALRIGCGVGSADNNRIMVADWNYTDVYQLKPASQSTQADINSTEQRIRFPAARTTQMVTLTNNGQGNLSISGVAAPSGISVNYTGGTLTPGQSTTFGVTYNGSSTVSGVVQFASNDPDENPLPIQVFARTSNLDPGEPAADFTLPLMSRDPQTGQWSQTSFTLSQQRGKVVYFNVYGSW